MELLGSKTYGEVDMLDDVPETLGDIKDGIEILASAGVLDTKLKFYLISVTGLYPVVLLHSNISKFFKTYEELGCPEDMTRARLEKVYKTLQSYDIRWLLNQPDGMKLKDPAGAIGSPICQFLSKVAYLEHDPLSDEDSWRIDFFQKIKPGTRVKVLEAKEIDGWTVVPEDESLAYIAFGRTSKMLALKHKLDGKGQ